MAEVQRRNTSASELGSDRRERRKSSIFFFNRTFKKSTTSKEENEGDSSPTTPVLGPIKDGVELKRTASGRSIPALAQTSTVTVEAERALSSSPKSASLALGEAAQVKSPEETKSSEAAEAEKPTEDLPTPPDTPGPSSTNAPTTNEEAQESAVDAQLPEVKKVSYHEDADLDIKVKESNNNDAVYAVRACVLETASPVWKQSSPSQNGTTIDLTSDPAFGLGVIFSIAHYRFQDVPQELGFGELYDVAVAAEKYQTPHLLVPFVKAWLSATSPPETTAVSQGDSDKALVAGYVLGQAQWFSQMISQCAYSSRVDAEGTLLDSGGKPWHEQPVSTEVVELIAAVRLEAIDDIIKAVSAPVNKLLNPQSYPDEAVCYCHAPAGDESIREECEQLQLGSAIMGLTKAKLWPPPEPSRIEASPIELARTYTDVRMRRYQTPGLQVQEGKDVEDGHAQCGFGHQGKFEKILAKSAQLTTGVLKELQARATTLGVYSEDVFKGLGEHLVEEAVTQE